MLADVIPYLKDETSTLNLRGYEERADRHRVPITIDLEVTDAPQIRRGHGHRRELKEVTLETGLKIQVPLFIKTGDVLRIDTRTGEYQTRV